MNQDSQQWLFDKVCKSYYESWLQLPVMAQSHALVMAIYLIDFQTYIISS